MILVAPFVRPSPAALSASPAALAVSLCAFLALSSTAQGIDVYYQGVHQESSIKQQPPETFDRILGLYLSDRNRAIQLPEREGPKDLFNLAKTVHLRLYSAKTQTALDRTATTQTSLQVVEAFVETADLSPNHLRLGKFVSQLQGSLYPRTPYSGGFVTPPQFVLDTFGADGLTGLGLEWVRFLPFRDPIDITYQLMRADHPLFAGPEQNGNFHSLALNAISGISEASNFSLSLKLGAQALGSKHEVKLWSAKLSYGFNAVVGRSIKAEAELLAEEAKARKEGRVRGGYLLQMIARLSPAVTLGLRRDAAGYQARHFNRVVRDSLVASFWLSREVAIDLQRSIVNPKNAALYNQTHLQLRLSLVKI